MAHQVCKRWEVTPREQGNASLGEITLHGKNVWLDEDTGRHSPLNGRPGWPSTQRTGKGVNGIIPYQRSEPGVSYSSPATERYLARRQWSSRLIISGPERRWGGKVTWDLTRPHTTLTQTTAKTPKQVISRNLVLPYIHSLSLIPEPASCLLN